MQHFLVRYDIDSAFFDLPKAEQTKLQDGEVEHAARVWDEGEWVLFLATTDRTINWGVYRCPSLQHVEDLLPHFPMYSWYKTEIHEISLVEPWKLGLDDLYIRLKDFRSKL